MRILLAAGLFVLTASASAQNAVDDFECGEARLPQFASEPNDVLMYEVARTAEVLDACTRPRAADGREDYLYTWGLRAKLTRMLTSPRLSFCAHDHARVLTSLGRSYDVALQASKTRRSIMDAALTAVIRDYFVAPSASWYPAMRKRSASQLLAAYEKARDECGSDTRCTAHFEGRIDGIRQAETSAQGRLNTATFGAGVSFGIDPISFISHLYNTEHAGLECRIGAGQMRITDIVGTKAEAWFTQVDLRLSQDVRSPELAAQRSLTQWRDPAAFEYAAHGRLLRVGSQQPVYLDKCAIEYAVSCSLIKVDTLQSCAALEQIRKLLAEYVPNPDNPNHQHGANAAKLSEYLAREGGYADTSAVVAAIEQRQLERCGNQR